ncbi:MAG TPA: hypothetical protein VGN46_14440 [Luteibacter sp.]|jgi:hypothetical protein|uniref:hypothetical protein n=1 Tax=Luteibacter sp. TaxID=1886636 RepID=UPI002F407887
MSDSIYYGIGDFTFSTVMMVCACWLLTDTRLSRIVRSGHAFIAAGALVNVLGLLADYFNYKGVEYGHVWPGEVIANFGTAVLMVTWLYRSLKKKREGRA